MHSLKLLDPLGSFCRAMGSSTRAAALVAAEPNRSNVAALREELNHAIRTVDQLSGFIQLSALQRKGIK